MTKVLSSCCGMPLTKVAGIFRCSNCLREYIQYEPYEKDPGHMYDIHQRKYERGEEE